MSARHLYGTCTGITGIKEITLRDNIASSATSIEITATSHSLTVGDFVTVDMGYTDDHTAVLTDGVVKRSQQRKPEFDYVIQIYDRLVLAQDNFIAPDDPDNPLSFVSAPPENIVQDMLTRSGITSTLHSTATGFLTGLTDNPYEVKLVTAWSVIENFNRIVAYMTWCDPSGDIWFNPRKPYIEGGDTASLALTTGNSGNILSVSYVKSDEQIRNKVVVYGKDGTGIKAIASASSAYLPVGFYKTLVLAHEIIDRQDMADATASYNLTMFNRLTESLTVKIKGKASLRCRDIVSVTEAYTGMAGDLWFVSASEHNWTETGYTTTVTLVR